MTSKTPGQLITLAAGDASGTLALNQSELNTVKATTLQLGDAAHTGKMTVASGGIAAMTQAPNITMINKTDGIDIKGNLAATTNLILTANAAGNTGAITQTTSGKTLSAGGNLTLNANGGIGVVAGNPIEIDTVAGNLSVDNKTGNTGGGDIYIKTGNITLGGGGITLSEQAAGILKIGATGNITIAGAVGVTPGSGGSVILSATGTILESAAGAGTVSANSVTLSGTGIGASTAPILTSATTLLKSDASAGGTYLSNTGNVNLLGSASAIFNVANTGTVNISGPVSATTVTLNPTGDVTGAGGAITATGLELLGSGRSYILSNSGNAITTVAGNTGTVNLTNNAASWSIGTAGSTAGLTTTGNTAFSSTGTATQTAPIIAAGLELLGAGGSYTLNNPNNRFTTLAANTGTVSLVYASSLNVGKVNNTEGITATGKVLLQTTGSNDITLTRAIRSSAAGDAVVLASGKNFINSIGATGITLTDNTGTGRWLIYSAKPSDNTFGSLDSNNVAVWNTTYSPASSVTQNGNRYLFSDKPILTFSSTSLQKTYGDDAAAAVASAYSVSGYSAGVTGAFKPDTASTAFSGSPLVTSDGSKVTATVDGSKYAITIVQDTLSPLNGYTFDFKSPGLLTVVPKDLTVNTLYASLIGSTTKIYDGTSVALLIPDNFSLSGLVGTDSFSVTKNSGTFATKDAGSGFINVSAILAATDFNPQNSTTLRSNYILPTTASGNIGKINPATLSISLTGPVTKTYDATTAATLNAGNYKLDGFITGENATVTKTAGIYETKNTGSSIKVSTTLTNLDYNPSNINTKLSNYILPANATGNIGTINQAPLSVALTGSAIKTYDATTAATLTPANYTLSGFVTGENATVTQTSGTYTTKNAGSGINISAVLAASDYKAATADTLLANYTLPTIASGAIGTINQAPLSAALTGSTSKIYDATTAANLTSANYKLSGFVNGENATVTQSTGTYATKNAGSGISISAVLAATDYKPESTGTLLTNYILPDKASGTIGTINQAALSIALTGSVTKTYDATITATLKPDNYKLSGFVSSESATVTQTVGTYDTTNAGNGINVTAVISGNYSPGSGTDLNNYTLPGTVTGPVGTINKARLTITAEDKSKSYGAENPQFTATYNGLKPGDTSSAISGLSFSTEAQRGSPPNTYSIIPGSAKSNNYEIAYVNGHLDVIGHPVPPILTQEMTLVMPTNPLASSKGNASNRSTGNPGSINTLNQIVSNANTTPLDSANNMIKSGSFTMVSSIVGSVFGTGGQTSPLEALESMPVNSSIANNRSIPVNAADSGAGSGGPGGGSRNSVIDSFGAGSSGTARDNNMSGRDMEIGSPGGKTGTNIDGVVSAVARETDNNQSMNSSYDHRQMQFGTSDIGVVLDGRHGVKK